MRTEQRSGYFYAAKDSSGKVYTYTDKPPKRDGLWRTLGYHHVYIGKTFLSKVLSWDDEEPLCFADYAPL